MKIFFFITPFDSSYKELVIHSSREALFQKLEVFNVQKIDKLFNKSKKSFIKYSKIDFYEKNFFFTLIDSSRRSDHEYVTQ